MRVPRTNVQKLFSALDDLLNFEDDALLSASKFILLSCVRYSMKIKKGHVVAPTPPASNPSAIRRDPIQFLPPTNKVQLVCTMGSTRWLTKVRQSHKAHQTRQLATADNTS